MQNASELELEKIESTILGLAENGVDLKKRGRRFILQDDLTRLKKKGPSKAFHVYLFNDMILFTEKAGSKKSPMRKYVSHNLLKDILFIDSEDSKDRHQFELLSKEEKKRQTLVAKNYLQKITWKHYLEIQIEKCCPSVEPSSNTVDESKNDFDDTDSWSMEFFNVHRSHSDLEMSEDDRSSVTTDSPSPTTFSHLNLLKENDWSAGSGDESCEDGIEENKSEEEDCEPSEEFQVRDEGGSVVLTAGSLNTILWWLVYNGDFSEPILIKTFLCSCYTYAPPQEIFSDLLKIYDLAVPVPSCLTLRYSLCDTRKRVTRFLKIWLESFFERDFSQDKKLYNQLLEFFKQIEKEDQEFEANLLKMAIIRVNKKRLIKKGYNRMSAPTMFSLNQKSNSSTNKLALSQGSLPITPKPSEISLIDCNVSTLAEQFALIEFALFKAVELKELCRLAWKSANPRKTALNLVNLFTRFDMVAQWVATEIVMAHTPRQRVVTIEKFIALAQKCVELRNFNSLQEIVAGLNRGSVQRMKKAWEGVSQSSYETFQGLNILVTPRNNFKNYRELVRKNLLPCLPYVGVYLQDLVFLEEGNTDKIGDLINYEKIRMHAKILKELQTFQKTGYSFEEDENLMPALRRLLAMPEEMLYKHSQSIEPTISNN